MVGDINLGIEVLDRTEFEFCLSANAFFLVDEF